MLSISLGAPRPWTTRWGYTEDNRRWIPKRFDARLQQIFVHLPTHAIYVTCQAYPLKTRRHVRLKTGPGTVIRIGRRRSDVPAGFQLPPSTNVQQFASMLQGMLNAAGSRPGVGQCRRDARVWIRAAACLFAVSYLPPNPSKVRLCYVLGPSRIYIQ